jgi:hypothetical protein
MLNPNTNQLGQNEWLRSVYERIRPISPINTTGTGFPVTFIVCRTLDPRPSDVALVTTEHSPGGRAT